MAEAVSKEMKLMDDFSKAAQNLIHAIAIAVENGEHELLEKYLSFTSNSETKFGIKLPLDQITARRIEYGIIDQDDSIYYDPLLHVAAWNQDIKSMKLLLKAGADVNNRNADGVTALYRAADKDFVDGVGLLLAYGADPTIALSNIITPRQLAEIKRSPSERMVTLLKTAEEIWVNSNQKTTIAGLVKQI